jgi:hypothetical protein
MHTLGHFDIYGCLFALVLLLIPARSLAYVLLAALLSAVLVLIHHIHLLMYVPTIAAIVVLRYYLVQGVSRQNTAAGFALLAAVGVLFVAAQFSGTMAVPETEFAAYLPTRRGPTCSVLPISGTSRWRRKFQTPGKSCRTISSAFPCSRC